MVVRPLRVGLPNRVGAAAVTPRQPQRLKRDRVADNLDVYDQQLDTLVGLAWWPPSPVPPVEVVTWGQPVLSVEPQPGGLQFSIAYLAPP